MKKTLAFLLALLLTFTMLPVSAFAAENPTFSVSSATGKAGDEVTVVVEIANNPGIWAYNYGIEYDTTRLEKVSYTGGGMDGGIWTIDKKVLWESSTFDNSTYNGETVVLKFKVKEDAPAGDAEIKIVDFFACNCDGNVVNADLVAGKVTVEGKLETVIPLTKDNHDPESENIRADKYGNVGGLKIEGIKIVDWTQWKQGGNYQSQSVTIYVDPESKDDIATLSLVLLNGQVASGPLIDNPATVDVQLKDGAGYYWAGRMKIGTGGLAPQLNLDIYFELAKEECEHEWNDATCTEPKTCSKCGATEGEANPDAHEWDEGKVTTEPTCSKAGVKTFTCKHNAQHTKTEEVAVDENAHNWGEAEYTWAEDGSSCTATRVCKNNETHKETADAEITSKTVKDATCEEKGETEYTAIFDVDWAAKQTKTVADISEKGHDWGEPEYKWADDGSSCEAKRVCNRNQQHIENAEATEIKSEVAKPATCSAMGDTRYEAIFAEDWAHDYKAITDIPVDEDAHEWGEWKVVREATYEEKGLKERECNLCEDKETDDIPKLVKPSKPSKPSDKPNPGVTVIVPGDKGEEEKNPNTGAPVVCSFDLTAAGVVVLAATAAVLEIKRRK